MSTIIKELNNSLKNLLEELLNKKNQTESSLSSVNEKITEKVDEAKQYKIEVDDAKNQINILEDEISSLETDLAELNEKFGKKDLKAIVEAGNIEINSKIAEKQKEITKHRHKISELTEKARSIKDLLINLKKDKIFKEEKLDNYTNAYNYYNESLTKIIDYSTNNSENLTVRETNYDYLKTKYNDEEPVSGVFDEIASIDNDLNNKKSEKDNVSEIEIEEKENLNDNIKLEKIENLNDNVEIEENEELNDSIEIEKETINHSIEKEKIEEELNDNTDFLEKLKNAAFELEDLEQTIDLEYNSIFDNNNEKEEEIKENNLEDIIEEKEIFKEVKEDENFTVHPNIFDEEVTIEDIENTNIPDIFGNKTITEEILNHEAPKIQDFFKTYAIDFDRFDNNLQDELKETFTPEMFKKTINILVKNNIDLNNIYNAGNIFIETSPIELEKIINKLLLAGQNTTNIGFVLNTLPSINSTDLTDVISSYGPDIKKANITDLIIKTQNISEIGKSE